MEIKEVDYNDVYLKTSGSNNKSLLAFLNKLEKLKLKEEGGKKNNVKSVSKAIGTKNYEPSIRCLSCNKDTPNKQPVTYFKISKNGNDKFIIKAECTICKKNKSKFIKATELPSDLDKVKCRTKSINIKK